MNKEQLRKELEDATEWGFNHNWINFKTWASDRDTYITTRLAALDDGDDSIMGIDFAKWIEENCEVIREPKITLYRYNDSRHGEGFGNYILDDIYTTYKELVGVDDGQEGKGLPKFLVIDDHENNYAIWTRGQYERYVSGALEVGGCPAVKIIAGFNGNEDFLFPQSTVSDGEGEKVGEFQQIFSYECSCGWKGEWDKLISKHGGPSCPKCGIVLSEGQPANGDEV